MAHYYGVLPTTLLNQTLGEYNLNLEIFLADMERTEIEKAERIAAAKNRQK